MYAKPDPSKKQNCGQDRPISINKTGKYNLNFIDWENEFDDVCEAEEAIRNGDIDSDDDAIYGMDIKTFEAIIAEDKYDECA